MKRSRIRPDRSLKRWRPTLPGQAGPLLVWDLGWKLGLVGRLDAAIQGVRQFKQRPRGLSGGRLLSCLAESIVAGGGHAAQLDLLREDEAGRELRASAEVPAPEIAGQLLWQFTPRQCEKVAAELAPAGVELDRLLRLPEGAPPQLDLDSTPIEVHGALREGANYNHAGKRSFGPLFCTREELRRVLGAALRPGSDPDGPVSPHVVRRAVGTLSKGHGRSGCRRTAASTARGLLIWCREHQLRLGAVAPSVSTHDHLPQRHHL